MLINSHNYTTHFLPFFKAEETKKIDLKSIKASKINVEEGLSILDLESRLEKKKIELKEKAKLKQKESMGPVEPGKDSNNKIVSFSRI